MRKQTKLLKMLNLPVTSINLPYSDFIPKVKKYFNNVWQTDWSNQQFNKLLAVKPILGVTSFQSVTNRRVEVILHRLRMGHTRLTHSWLLDKEDQPQCTTCQCPCTVEHLLTSCTHLNAIKQKYFTSNNMRDIFTTTTPSNIIEFLKEINLYDKI